VRRIAGWVLVVATVGSCVAVSVRATAPGGSEEEFEGLAPRPAWEAAPAVEATFLRDSYRPGAAASLVLWHKEQAFTVQLFRAGQSNLAPSSNITMRGVAVSRVVRFGPTAAHTPVELRIGNWPSGLYFARLQAGGRVGFSPFVVRPRTLGGHRVLVVLPTFTWQAYNFRDDDRDGRGDTWYAATDITTARLARPYLARGVPPHFRSYDLPFLQWLHRTGKSADFFSDSDLAAAARGAALARAYDLIVFPGHHEYVTEREYDLVTDYRNRGGHLMFLSANNFFYKVARSGDTLTRVARWRDIGRPEAALIGVQFLKNDNGVHQAPWIVRNTTRWPWLFGDTGVRVGDTFGHGGIEIDHLAASSPANVTVLAEMPNLFGPGYTAQMSYYETPAGAKVFAAGAFTLGGARNPISRHILQHLWNHLTDRGTQASQGSPLRMRDLGMPSRAHKLNPSVGRVSAVRPALTPG
jgi:hypothetical protein